MHFGNGISNGLAHYILGVIVIGQFVYVPPRRHPELPIRKEVDVSFEVLLALDKVSNALDLNFRECRGPLAIVRKLIRRRPRFPPMLVPVTSRINSNTNFTVTSGERSEQWSEL